jgi:hypothetical protein
MPEPGEIRRGALASLRPHVSVPRPARAAFGVAVPCIVGSWALGGFYLSLGPSLIVQQLDSTNIVWGGISIALLCGVGAAATVARHGQDPGRMMLHGCFALVAGGVVGVAAIALGFPAALFISAAVAGLGFGPVFVGAFRTIVARAPADDRAALVAAIFTVAYVSFGVPALAAGFATTRYGLRSTALVYSAVVVVLAGAAAVSSGSRVSRPATRR